MKENGSFKKKTGFTITGNALVRDKNLSLKAKGLYLLIMSYITLDELDLTKTFLQKMCSEGAKAFCSAWNELKEAGYLKVHMMPSKRGWRTEYELLEEPLDGAHTFYHSSIGEVTNTNLTISRTNPVQEHENQRTPQKGIYATGSNAQGICANGGNNIKTSGKTKNNTFDNTQSVYPLPPCDELTDRIDAYRLLLMENIEYDYLCGQYGQERTDEIVEVLLDAVCTTKPYLRVDGEDKPTEVVKNRLLKLDQCHIEYCFDRLDNNTTKIRNIKAYLLTTLYNAPTTISHYYDAEVRHDLSSGRLYSPA